MSGRHHAGRAMMAGLACMVLSMNLSGCPPRKPTPVASPPGSFQPGNHQGFQLKEGDAMLAELAIIPIGRGQHISSAIAPAIALIETSGLPYQLTPSGTCIEGEWDRVMPLIRRCHDRVRESSPHVITMIKIEDEEGAHDKLTRNVESVREIIGESGSRGRTPITAETPPSHP